MKSKLGDINTLFLQEISELILQIRINLRQVTQPFLVTETLPMHKATVSQNCEKQKSQINTVYSSDNTK